MKNKLIIGLLLLLLLMTGCTDFYTHEYVDVCRENNYSYYSSINESHFNCCHVSVNEDLKRNHENANCEIYPK